MSVVEWDTKEKDALRTWLDGLLHEGVVTVTFEKKDGTTREMNCTLKDTPVVEKKTDIVRKPNNEVMSVFDVDLQEWRSFRLESIKQIEICL
jgi:hypothetical protein